MSVSSRDQADMDDSMENSDCLILGNEGDVLIQVPASINKHLYPYQREGVHFLYGRYRENAGAILADDMGLGKTIQSIAFVAAILLKSDGSDGRATPPFLWSLESAEPAPAAPVRPPPVLVICPAAVLYNWLAELNTWGSFDVGLFVRDKRSEVLRAARNRTLDVVLSSFEAARDHVIALNGPDWSAVIVDEAHRLKSMTSLVTQALSGLHCRRRIGLSGTVVQNDLREFWCLLDWANPGCLGTCDRFVNDFVRPIERGRRRGAVKRDVAESWQQRELLATLRQQWVLRRTKALIADQLPNKTDQIVYCPPSPLQQQVYRAALANPDVQMMVRRSRPCACGSHRKAARCCLKHEPSPPAGVALSFMGLLLKISNHPCLLLPSGAASAQQNKMARQACQSVFEDFPELARLSRTQAYRALSDPKYCGKMKVLTTLIEHFRQKSQKVLVFSYSTRMLKIIRAYVLNQGFDLTYIDGETPASERPRLCQQFCQLPHWAVALVSTRAGGQGLNIVGATAVVVFDPSWNPAHDLQAQDRAYRLGQTRDVSVFRLISAGTIEENIYLRQVYKQQLSTLAVEGGAGPRLFTASAGRGGQPGELFGLHNLLQLRDDERLTERLLETHRRLERLLTAAAGHEVTGALPEVQTGVAGLAVIDYTAVAPSDGGEVLPSDDEAEQLTPAGGQQADETREDVTASVGEALRDCGVRHVHGNAALVAASRMEEHVARQAAHAVFQLGAGTQETAERCAPLPPQPGASGRRPRLDPGRLPAVPRFGLDRPTDQPGPSGASVRLTEPAEPAGRPVPLPPDHSRVRAAGARISRRLPAALTGELQDGPELQQAGTSRRRRTHGAGQVSPGQVISGQVTPGHRRSAAGRGSRSSGGRREDRRRRDSGRDRTRRSGQRSHRARLVDTATNTDGEQEVVSRLAETAGAAAGDVGGDGGAAGTAAQERDGIGSPRTSDIGSDVSVIPAIPPCREVSPVAAAAEGGRETGPQPPPAVTPPRSPAAANGADAVRGPSTPKRPRSVGGAAVDALLDRLLESPTRRPPPSHRRPTGRPRPRSAAASAAADGRQETDLISSWLKDGKVSIAE